MLFGLAMILFYPFRFVFEFDPDEGINLMKSMLQLRGYSLYFDVYSDQPPLFTLFLTALFGLMEPNVTLARLGVLAFSMVLVGSAVWSLLFEWDGLHAFVAVIFLILAPFFLELSVAVMIGLPAIALSFLSFALALHWAASNSRLSLILSGVLIAAAILTKAFVAPMGLVLAGAVFLRFGQKDPSGERGRVALAPLLLWGGVAGCLLLIAGVLIGPGNWSQLVASHLQSSELVEFINRKTVNDYLVDGRGLLVLGLVGGGYSLLDRKWTALPLLIWGAINYLLLTQLNPVWYHHSLLVTVPAALLAAMPVGDAFSWIVLAVQERRFLDKSALLGAGMLVFVGILLYPRFPVIASDFDLGFPNLSRGPKPESLDFIHMAEMSELRGPDEVVVTDRPMFPFRMGKIVPPNLAVWSNKRFETGELTEAQVIEEIERWKPTQVLIGRYLAPGIIQYLQENADYIREYHYGDFRLYQRR